MFLMLRYISWTPQYRPSFHIHSLSLSFFGGIGSIDFKRCQCLMLTDSCNFVGVSGTGACLCVCVYVCFSSFDFDGTRLFIPCIYKAIVKLFRFIFSF